MSRIRQTGGVTGIAMLKLLLTVRFKARNQNCHSMLLFKIIFDDRRVVLILTQMQAYKYSYSKESNRF